MSAASKIILSHDHDGTGAPLSGLYLLEILLDSVSSWSSAVLGKSPWVCGHSIS